MTRLYYFKPVSVLHCQIVALTYTRYARKIYHSWNFRRDRFIHRLNVNECILVVTISQRWATCGT
jgi:hypothetical protein